MNVSLIPVILIFSLRVFPQLRPGSCSSQTVLFSPGRAGSSAHVHMYITVDSEHTDRDNPFFSKAIFKTIYYGLSFISSSIFLFSAYSHDLYLLGKTKQITFFLVHPMSTSQSLREIILHIFQDL